MIPAMRSRLVACILIVFTFVGTSGAWHAGDDDPDYTTPAAHDHAAHHATVNVATTATEAGHCAICHWLQTFRIDSVPDMRVVFGDAARAPFLALTRRAAPLLVRLDIPSRAPPA